MPFGSVLSKFSGFNATTADEKIIKIKNNFFIRIAFLILGLPHIGIRLRARKILKNINTSGEYLLDAGCGTGVYSFYFSNKFWRVYSIDLDKEKISDAKKINIFKNIDFLNADLCKLPFKDNFFDIIICSDVLEHIKDDKKAISELVRVLKKGGNLIITVPYNSSKNKETYKRYNHKRAGYNIQDFKKIIKDLKANIEKTGGYSYTLSDKISDFSYRFIDNKIITGLIFYPLFFLALLIDYLKIGEPNGLFIKIKKY